MAIKVGSIARIKKEYKDLFGLMSAIDGTDYTGAGVVTEVEPSNETLANKYPEINPNADTRGKFIYYDKGAGRHFLVSVESAVGGER